MVLRPATSQDRCQGGMQDLEELSLEKPQGPLGASRCGHQWAGKNPSPPISATLHDDPLRVAGGGPMGRELKNMRTVNLIMRSALFVQVAHAQDQIRLSTFPNVMLGTWAETTQQCAAKDKSNVVIEPAKYGDGDGSCEIRWIDQSEGSRGINY